MISIDLDIDALARTQEREHYHERLDEVLASKEGHFSIDIHNHSVVSFEFNSKEKTD